MRRPPVVAGSAKAMKAFRAPKTSSACVRFMRGERRVASARSILQQHDLPAGDPRPGGAGGLGGEAVGPGVEDDGAARDRVGAGPEGDARKIPLEEDVARGVGLGVPEVARVALPVESE